MYLETHFKSLGTGVLHLVMSKSLCGNTQNQGVCKNQKNDIILSLDGKTAGKSKKAPPKFFPRLVLGLP